MKPSIHCGKLTPSKANIPNTTKKEVRFCGLSVALPLLICSSINGQCKKSWIKEVKLCGSSVGLSPIAL